MNALGTVLTGHNSTYIGIPSGNTGLNQHFRKERSLDNSTTNYVGATYTSASSLV